MYKYKYLTVSLSSHRDKLIGLLDKGWEIYSSAGTQGSIHYVLRKWRHIIDPATIKSK